MLRMTTPITAHKGALKVKEPFISEKVARSAFTISILALSLISPLSLLLGTATGVVIQYHIDPNFKFKPTDKIVTLTTVVFALIGALAAIASLTPLGLIGGIFLQAVPFAASLGIGHAAYRGFKSIESTLPAMFRLS